MSRFYTRVLSSLGVYQGFMRKSQRLGAGGWMVVNIKKKGKANGSL